MKAEGSIAYFCMEYGLDSSFKIYSGGLGILAGDHLKAARDAKLPMVGIGILWKQGYVEQHIDGDGKVVDCYRDIDRSHVEDTGLRVMVRIREDQVPVKVWKTEAFDNVPLYLLDTDVPESSYHWITRNLYGGNEEVRVAQEIILGVGGVKVLRALKIPVKTYHFNEGHAVLAGLALIREKMDAGEDFYSAWRKTRRKIVFTTHTPVSAGNESHSMTRLRYMGADQGFTIEQLAEIGGIPFNMTVAGLRLSRKTNAVSALHLETTQSMWRHIKGKSRIIHITNGVHRTTWMDETFSREKLTPQEVADCHHKNKIELLQMIQRQTGTSLNSDKLLIGFARRSTPYKRSGLIFDQEELMAPLLRSQRIQLVYAGKAHPMDENGKELLLFLSEQQKKYPHSVVLLEGYDMEMGKTLTRGCDVWLNNPQRPKEACGTSGMKAAMNGVLNASILDGWWAEACRHGENGWAIGDEKVPKNENRQDRKDATALAKLLVETIVPMYEQNRDVWNQMMCNSILDTRNQFSAARMVTEYAEEMYTNGA